MPDDVGILVEHIYKCFLSVLSSARRPQTWGSDEELVPSFLPVAHQPHWTGRGQGKEGIMFGELRVLLFVLVVCMGGWEWMCE